MFAFGLFTIKESLSPSKEDKMVMQLIGRITKRVACNKVLFETQ